MKKNCLLIIPYFGSLPNYFQLFLNSCAFNRSMDFLLFTNDRREFDYPDNVSVKYCAFDSIREIARKKIDENINLDTPKKLCDFKPTYGYLFEEYLNDYKYWGHCDIDLILGDLDHFIVPIIKESYYDKIFNLGHLTLYRNRTDINRLFMQEIQDNIKESIFFKKESCKFDEENHPRSIVKYAIKNNLKIYTNQLEADIATKSNQLILDQYDFSYDTHRYVKQRNLFIYDRGKIKRFYVDKNEIKVDEYAYIHLQKRKMDMDVALIKNAEQYVIAANRFYIPIIPDLDLSNISIKDFEKIKVFFFNIHYFSLRWRNLVAKVKYFLRLA